MNPPVNKPKWKSRSLLVIVTVLVVIGVVLVLALPGTPLYLPKLLEPEQRYNELTGTEWTVALADPDPKRRTEAAASLSKLTAAAPKTLPKLVEVMRADPDGDVRAAASDAVGKMFPVEADPAGKGAYAAIVMEALTSGLTDSELRVRHNAALTLLKLRQLAGPALPTLLTACKDPANETNLNIYPATIQQVMLRALGEAAAGTPAAVATLAAVFDNSPTVPKSAPGRGRGNLSEEESTAWTKYATWMVTRRVAVAGLGLAGEHGRPHAAKIRELLQSKDADDRYEAKQALERMGLSDGGQ